jgi:hypothetical protein
MRTAGVNPRLMKSKADLEVLPQKVRQIADNYNHLHEQPTLFYALAIYSHLAGMADAVNVTLAWSYVGLRIVHSLIQCTVNFVPARFAVFTLCALVLMAMTVRNVIALMPVGPCWCSACALHHHRAGTHCDPRCWPPGAAHPCRRFPASLGKTGPPLLVPAN